MRVVSFTLCGLQDKDKRLTRSVADDPEIFHGAHVGVQLVGRRLQEEKMLALAEYVGKVLGK